ncbi:IS5/IS1182 family transposase, partial [Paraburkholderia sediminicola]
VPKPLTSASRKKGLFTKADFVYVAKSDVYRCPAGERAILRFTTVEHDMNLRVYWPSACPRCPMKERCSPSDKHWMGPAHFLTRTLGRVSTEMSLQVLAYNLKRVMKILGVAGTMKAMKMAGS